MNAPKSQQLLLDAIDQCNVSGVLMSLAMGADANALDKQGRSPLHRAMDVGMGPGLHQMVQSLLEHGADPLRQAPGARESLLLKSVLLGDEQLTSLFLQEGVSVSMADAHNVTPLMAAADVGSAKLCELILNASSRKNAVLEMRDHMGRTALMHGAANADVALFLLASGADPRCKDGRGLSAIDLATDSAVRALMRTKASALDAQDEQGKHLAESNANDLADVMAMAMRMSSDVLGSNNDQAIGKPKIRP